MEEIQHTLDQEVLAASAEMKPEEEKNAYEQEYENEAPEALISTELRRYILEALELPPSATVASQAPRLARLTAFTLPEQGEYGVAEFPRQTAEGEVLDLIVDATVRARARKDLLERSALWTEEDIVRAKAELQRSLRYLQH